MCLCSRSEKSSTSPTWHSAPGVILGETLNDWLDPSSSFCRFPRPLVYCSIAYQGSFSSLVTRCFSSVSGESAERQKRSRSRRTSVKKKKKSHYKLKAPLWVTPRRKGDKPASAGVESGCCCGNRCAGEKACRSFKSTLAHKEKKKKKKSSAASSTLHGFLL